MRFLTRSIFLAVSALAVAVVPLAAQHRGAPVRSAPYAAPRAAGRTAPYGGRPYPVPPSVALQHPELSPHAAGFTGIRPGAYSNTGRYYYHGGDRHQRGGGYLPFSYFSAPYLPFFDYSDYYDANQQSNAAADAAAAQAQTDTVTQNLLGEQVQRLSAEVDSLRNQPAQQLPAAQQPASPASPDPVPDQAPPQPPITVVLKSGRKVQVQNYAVMGQTFWDFTTQPARKIPVSSINVAESINASNANGAEFPSLTPSR